jgi:hypothetical protein
MDRERFDDVGFELLEVPDAAPRRFRPHWRFLGLGVLAGSLASLAAAAALATTPAQAPQASAPGGAPASFTAERYPARHGGMCHRHDGSRRWDGHGSRPDGGGADFAPRY